MANDGTGGGGGNGDLLVLVADSNMESTVRDVLARPESLDIRPVTFEVYPHPRRDPGVFHRAPTFLRDLQDSYQHALVLLDREGSGREDREEAEEMEKDLERRLRENVQAPCAAVVIDPELEIWVWSDSPEVDKALGWSGETPTLRSWLAQEGYLDETESKPERPKEAVEAALKRAREPRSSVLYGQLARKVSLNRCQDRAFRRLCRILQRWFPRSPGQGSAS